MQFLVNYHKKHEKLQKKIITCKIKDVSLHSGYIIDNNKNRTNMVDKYTKQVLDFLRNTSKENKEAEWDRISNLGLPNIGAFTFVENAMFDIKC